MRVRDLGPVRLVVDDVELPTAGPKQAAILSVLAMRAGERVSVDQLIVAGWGYDGDISTSTVENHIWRLRRLIEPHRGRAASTTLVNEETGYRLRLADEDIDSARFEKLAERSRRDLDAGDLANSLAACDEALHLWRGVPYEAIAHLAETGAVVGRLEELRGQVMERRIDMLLRLGEVDRALADLELLLAAFPFRERLWAQRMSGLARAGRADDALAAYQRVRGMLLDELGLEPGPELRELQRQIIDRAPAVSAVSAVATVAPAVRSVPSGGIHLPKRPLPLLGRQVELRGLSTWLRQRDLVTITGPGGTGKTRLALEVAAAAAADFPDGVWFVDLTEVVDSELVVDAVVSRLGITAGADGVGIDANVRTLTTFVGERTLLLVLDNCEHVLDGVAAVTEALLDNKCRSVVLATSREPIEVPGEALWPLSPLPLSAAAGPSPAAEMFLARMTGPAAVDPEDLATVERICAAVDGLPLAIELAAARSRAYTLDEIAAQVGHDPGRLSRIGRGPADHRTTVESTIEWSHRLLSPTEQAVHSRLAVLPGPFTLPVATAVAQGVDVDVSEVPDLLARLVHRSMLTAGPSTRRGRPSTFHQLETVRAHATHRLAATGGIAQVLARRDDWVRQLLTARPKLGDPGTPAWYDAIDDVFPIVRATFQTAVVADPDPALLRRSAGLNYFFYFRNRLIEGRRWQQAVADACGLVDGRLDHRPEAVLFRIALAGSHLLSGDASIAARQMTSIEALIAGVPDDLLVEAGEALVATGHSAWGRNEYDIALRISAVLSTVARRSGAPHLLLLADQVDTVAHLADRDPVETADRAEAVYERAAAQSNELAEWSAAAARSIVATLAGDAGGGLLWIDRVIAAHSRCGTGGGGAFLELLANFAALSEDAELAARMYGAAFAEVRRVGMVWPVQINTQELVDRTRSALARGLFDDLWHDGTRLTYLDVARDRGLVPA